MNDAISIWLFLKVSLFEFIKEPSLDTNPISLLIKKLSSDLKILFSPALFAVSIFLIVITIKSSIVLSLGLVGALSIIRFRTAIKEAEQIVYFLILTGVSIATAANSYLFPIIFVFFVFVYNFYLNNNKENIIHSVNDQLVITVNKIDTAKSGKISAIIFLFDTDTEYFI